MLARGRSRIYGVQLGRMVRRLEGRDCIVGVKFRPGAFYPFLQRPVRSLTNGSVPATELLQGAERAEREAQNCRDERARVEIASRLQRFQKAGRPLAGGVSRDLMFQRLEAQPRNESKTMV